MRIKQLGRMMESVYEFCPECDPLLYWSYPIMRKSDRFMADLIATLERIDADDGVPTFLVGIFLV